MVKYPVFFIILLVSLQCKAGLTAEQVLGEYWKDPLFGEAATEETVSIELLFDGIWPAKISVPKDTNIRFVFNNKSAQSHLVAFTADLTELLADQAFQKFVEDELYHSQQTVVSGTGHSHSGTSVSEAEALVKTLKQRPTVFVKAGDLKEILIRFDQVMSLSYVCVLDEHEGMAFTGQLKVIENDIRLKR